MDSGQLYTIKNQLDKRYGNLCRNDLLWLLAIQQHSPIQRAHFSGDMVHYLSSITDELDAVKTRIAAAGCNAIPDLGFRFVKKAGSSGARLYQATINGISVMLKRTNADPDQDPDGVIYETLIYKYFFDYMVTHNITPNVPFYYGSMVCKVDEDNEYNDMYSEAMDGSEFKEYLDRFITPLTPLPVTFWRPVIFQILYTLVCFEELNIKHNDLHIKNIFFDPDVRGTIKYHTKVNEYFMVSLDDCGLIKIFDMDMAGVDCKADKVAGTERIYDNFRDDLEQLIDINYPDSECYNRRLQGVETFGLTSQGKSSIDLFIAICTILYNTHFGYNYYYSELLDQETKNFFDNIFNPVDIYNSVNEYSTEFSGFHCRSKKISDAGNLVSRLLTHPYFDPLRNINEDSDNNYHLPSLALRN